MFTIVHSFLLYFYCSFCPAGRYNMFSIPSLLSTNMLWIWVICILFSAPIVLQEFMQTLFLMRTIKNYFHYYDTTYAAFGIQLYLCCWKRSCISRYILTWLYLVAHHYCITHTKCIPHILCLCGASRIRHD